MASSGQTGDEILVSVVIPAYNPGDLIFEAVDSVLSQTLGGVECIIVDNGSTDGLQERLAKYGDLIEVIRFDHNKRPAAARNEGIRRARGRYIALLDADDRWMDERLARLVGHLEAHPEHAIATSDAYLLVDGQETTTSWFSTGGTTFHTRDQDVNIFRGNYLSNLLVYRKELFDKHGLFDEESWCEDWERNIAFIMAGARAAFVPEPLAYYRITPGSLSKNYLLMSRDSRDILDRWISRGLHPRAMRVAKASRARFEWDLVKAELFGGNKKQVRRRLHALIFDGPRDVKLKALVWSILPSRLVIKIHRRRAEFVRRNGGAFALHEAARSIRSGDLASARGSLAAAVLFGYPLKTRVLALLWLLIVPARRRLSRRLLDDPALQAVPDGRVEPLHGGSS